MPRRRTFSLLDLTFGLLALPFVLLAALLLTLWAGGFLLLERWRTRRRVR